MLLTAPTDAWSAQATDSEAWRKQVIEKLEPLLPAPVPELTDTIAVAPGAYLENTRGVAPGGECGIEDSYARVVYQFCLASVRKTWLHPPTGFLARWDELQRQLKAVEAKMVSLGAGAKPEEYVKLGEETQRIGTGESELRRSVRRVRIGMEANGHPQRWVAFDTPAPPPSGTLGGYPLYRIASTDVRLGVLVAPRGFRNPDMPRAMGARRVVKGVLVWAQCDPGDEAIARRMLERVDYAAVARLLTP